MTTALKTALISVISRPLSVNPRLSVIPAQAGIVRP